MVGQIIKYLGKYKKCRANTKDCTANQVGVLAKRIKYFRHDMLAGLRMIEEQVAEDRAQTDPIKASKIEDYAKNREFRDVFKGVTWNRNKLTEACDELKELLTTAHDSELCLNKLKDEIEKELKKQDKKAKPDKDTEKLLNQIDDDLKEIKIIFAQSKKIPADHRNPEKEYDDETKKIMKVKASLSPAQQKFNTLYPKMLSEKALKNAKSEFEKKFKELLEFAGAAEKAAQKGEVKALTENFQKGQKHFQALEKVEVEYSKIAKKYSKQIKKASNTAVIEKTIKLFANQKTGAEKKWEKTVEEIKKATAK